MPSLSGSQGTATSVTAKPQDIHNCVCHPVPRAGQQASGRVTAGGRHLGLFVFLISFFLPRIDCKHE